MTPNARFRKASFNQRIAVPRQKDERHEAKPSSGSWTTRLLFIITVSGLALYLLGYGVALSIEDSLNIPSGTVISSSFELLQLATWAVVHLLTNLNAVIKKSQLLSTFGYELLKISVLLALSFFALTTLIKVSPAWSRIWIRNQLKILVAKPTPADPWSATFSRSVAVLLAFPAAAALGVVLWVAALIVGIVVLTTLPIIGMSAGNAHIAKYVVEPKQCTPLKSQLVRTAGKKVSNQEVYADCVEVVHDGKPITKGRVVFGLSEAIVLYAPDTGAVQRVPVKDNIIQSISKLDTVVKP